MLTWHLSRFISENWNAYWAQCIRSEPDGEDELIYDSIAEIRAIYRILVYGTINKMSFECKWIAITLDFEINKHIMILMKRNAHNVVYISCLSSMYSFPTFAYSPLGIIFLAKMLSIQNVKIWSMFNELKSKQFKESSQFKWQLKVQQVI